MCAGRIGLWQQCEWLFQLIYLHGRVLASQLQTGVAQAAQLRQVRRVEV